MVRVLIVEDQKIMQKYFEYIILQNPEFKLVDTVSDAREAVKICNYAGIDLVLMDVQTFHNHDGLAAGKTIKKEHPGTKILIVTSLIDPKVLESVQKQDVQTVCGIRITERRRFSDVITQDTEWRTVSFRMMTPDVELNWVTSGEISPRQLEMLRLYICGMSYSEIAKKMNCSTSGVRWNFQDMIARAGYSCKEDLIAAALESKLIVTTLK